MTCEMHEYYLVLNVHIHITSKNGDVCKLCATERIFRLTWPQLWRHRSNVRGVRVLKFSVERKKDGRKPYKKMWHSTGKQKRYSRKTAGGASPPVPARVNPRLDGDPKAPPCWFFTNTSNSVGNSALKFSVPLRASIIRILWKILLEVTQGQKL